MWSHVKKRAFELAKESKDFPKIACVIYDKQTGKIITEGIAGTPNGIQHCDTRYNNETKHNHLIHAEMRAVLSLIHNKPTKRMGAMVVGKSVCVDCAKALVEVGIHEVYMPPIDEVGRWADKAEAGLELMEDANITINIHNDLIGYHEKLNDGTKFPSMFNKSNTVDLKKPIAVTQLTTLDGTTYDVYKIEPIRDDSFNNSPMGLHRFYGYEGDAEFNVPFRVLTLTICKTGEYSMYRMLTERGLTRKKLNFFRRMLCSEPMRINVLIFNIDGVSYVYPLPKDNYKFDKVEKKITRAIVSLKKVKVSDLNSVISYSGWVGHNYPLTDLGEGIMLRIHNVERTTMKTQPTKNQILECLPEPDYHGQQNADPSTHKLVF